MLKNLGLSSKILLLVLGSVILTAGSSIYLSYQNAATALQQAIGVRLQGIASTASLMIDGDLHEQIKGEADSKSKAFLKLRAILRKVKEANNLATDIYTLRRKSKKRAMKFIVMTNKDHYIGDSYKPPKEVQPVMEKVFSLNKSAHTGIYSTENGNWITAYAPILDSKGQLVAVLNVDTKLSTYRAQLRNEIMSMLIIDVSILFFGLLISFFFASRLVGRLRKLSEATERMSLGQQTSPLEVDSNDEVGQLARGLNRMHESLRVAMEMLDDDDD